MSPNAQHLRIVTYRRVSTDEQADSGHGLAAQAEAIGREVARRPGWTVVAEMIDEGFSAKAGTVQTRPALSEALRMLAAGEADVLLAAKIDRVTRSVADLALLMDDASTQGWSLVGVDTPDLDMTTATGRLFANIMSSVSQWEREVIAERTRAALAAAKASGTRLGRPVSTPQHVRDRMASLREEGLSMDAIADTLTAEGILNAAGNPYNRKTVHKMLRSIELDRQAEQARQDAA